MRSIFLTSFSLNVNIKTTFIYYNERVFILQFSGSLAAALLIMQNLSALGLAAFTVQVILPLATPLATLLGDSH